EYIAPTLIGMSGRLIKPGWKTLELLEHIGAIYKAINNIDSNARQSPVQCTRSSKEGVIIDYSSPRKMCTVAKGIVKGIAKHYNEQVLITEKDCMLKGSVKCSISVLVVGDSLGLNENALNLPATSSGR